jgi:release factor glutamine methyltransferase
MLTVLNSILLSADYLKNKGIDSARINAELLLANILDCKRMDLYLRFDQPLTKIETEEYRKALKRRATKEPLQYIIGEVEFYGLLFNVNPKVLIPRQETEILIEHILENLINNNDTKILDIGSGSGNIIISLIKNIKNSEGIAIDISDDAIAVAEKNAELNGVTQRISFIKKDILRDDIENLGKFDIVVSNPPYVSKEEFNTLQKEILDHEPKYAVTDFGDGFTFYKIISEKSKSLLKPNGKLFFEVGYNQAGEVKEIMEKNNFKEIKIIKDYSDIDRVVYGEII